MEYLSQLIALRTNTNESANSSSIVRFNNTCWLSLCRRGVILAMSSGIFITAHGYDPDKGRSIKDPYLGRTPTFGACMPNIRRRVEPGEYIFMISGGVPGVQQYVVGGFEVAAKIDVMTAYKLFPEHHLRRLDNGELTGNIIVNSQGKQHHLDPHPSDTFERRIENYIVGRDPIVLTAPHEIARGREETIEILRSIFRKTGARPVDIIGRGGRKMDLSQAMDLRDWLLSVKSGG